MKLSPSEATAFDAAERVSGTTRRARGANADPAAPKTQKALASIMLGFEVLVVLLIGLAIHGLGLLDPRWLGLVIAGTLILACIVSLGLMRVGRIGIVCGWVTHGLMVATAAIMPMSLVVSLPFLALWIFCMIKGAQVDRDRIAYYRTHGQ